MPTTGSRQVYTVTQITQKIKLILDTNFPGVWVEGEVSNFRQPTSGHIYFTLKDNFSQLRAVIFKNINMGLRFELRDGLSVICFGKVSVYQRDGLYQLYVERIEPKGIGALQLAFQQLKERLAKEGLFDLAHKRPIPFLPKRIGIITSPTGAVIRDMLNIIDRRFKDVEIIINPVRVQGEGAAEDIAQAIKELNLLGDIDTIILARGGGSLEDLWEFNEEIVARAIYNSKIPIISAVGHEIDWTISDFVADLRAPTPSVAAEMVLPKKEDLAGRIDQFLIRLKNTLLNKITFLRRHLNALKESYYLQAPKDLILQYQQRVDDLIRRLTTQIVYNLELQGSDLKSKIGKLEALSPLNILSRGYSITLKLPKRLIIKDVKVLKEADKVETKLWKGSFISKVESVSEDAT
jgi:exodeoxyribonuclease VII large subunit